MISNYLIIYRVAQGRAWDAGTLSKAGPASSVHFRTPSTFTGRDTTTQNMSMSQSHDNSSHTTPSTMVDFQLQRMKSKDEASHGSSEKIDMTSIVHENIDRDSGSQV